MSGQEEDPDYIPSVRFREHFHSLRNLQAEPEDEDTGHQEDEDGDVRMVEAPRVSNGDPSISAHVRSLDEVGEEGAMEGREACSADEVSEENEWNRSQIEGLFCPICMEAWTDSGEHQICCLPCGHTYGMKCISKWLKQCGSSGRCPQCNSKCTLKGVRKLFAPRIVVIDEESQKKIRSLEAKCTSFEKKDADWCTKEAEWQKREADLHLQVCQLAERTTYLEHLLGDAKSGQSGFIADSGECQGQIVSGRNLGSNYCRQGSCCSFELQKELWVQGARLFDMDASNQILIIARRLSGMGGTHILTKMSLMCPHEEEDILLPSGTKAVKDLRISPSGVSLALFASLGKKLSVLSTDSNNVILTYDLPAPAWSCSWDLNSSHHIYAGLQNGLLMVFDMRQTVRPMETLRGLTCNPIHTVHSLSYSSTLPAGARTVLTASSVGVCQRNFGGGNERPFLVPGSENQGICISLSYCPSSNDIVASYRPRVSRYSEMAISQPSLTPSSVFGQVAQGSHIFLKRVGSRCYTKWAAACANVTDIRLPKSAIIETGNQNNLFASGDEVTGELILQELPSFRVVQRLPVKNHHFHDMKYRHVLGQDVLGCLTEDTLQLFNAKHS